MNGYIINFAVYTMAMIGIMFLSVFVYKKSMNVASKKGSKNGMQIEESLNLSPKKTLFVVKVDGEKFLIASDMERTSFLAKLGDKPVQLDKDGTSFASYMNNAGQTIAKPVDEPFEVDIEEMRKVARMREKMEQNPKNKPVMRNLAQQVKLKRG